MAASLRRQLADHLFLGRDHMSEQDDDTVNSSAAAKSASETALYRVRARSVETGETTTIPGEPMSLKDAISTVEWMNIACFGMLEHFVETAEGRPSVP